MRPSLIAVSAFVARAACMKIEGVNVFGPVEVASGLGTAVRGHLRAMWQAGLRTRVFPFRFSSRQGTQRFDWPPEPASFDTAIVYANPDATDFVESAVGREIRKASRRIGVWVWELPAALNEHVKWTSHYDEIWVPSQFNCRAFRAVTKTPVHVVPYVVEPAASSGTDYRARLSLSREAFVFMYVFDPLSYVERKNPLALLRAYTDSFPDGGNTALVFKASRLEPGSPFAIEFAQASARRADLRLVGETLEEAELSALMMAADCYVSPHRTEGFGFTLAEAMALGKPVVATDYGSTRDFLNAGTGFPVSCAMVEVGEYLGPYPSGAVWADVDVAQLGREMRRVREASEERACRAAAGTAHVAAQFSRERIGGRILSLLEAGVTV